MTLEQVVVHLKAIRARKVDEHLGRITEHLFTFAGKEDVEKYFAKTTGQNITRPGDMDRLVHDLAMLGVQVKYGAIEGKLE